MKGQVAVNLDFINKKGKQKQVRFYMDKQTYEMLFDESISKEIRHQYLVNEYHEYERERYHRRKFVSFDAEMADMMRIREESTESSEEKYIKELEKLEMKEAIRKLITRQQDFVRLVYYEGRSQEEVASIYGITKSAVSHAMKKIYVNLRKILNNNR
ncbi:MAG: sigma-70 family RNA polymerase sigma factor [Crenarchaeota archaeon]|nr:sigma-70 family RNA polymerase sigma factor [Thermoproteota archaeon]